MLWRHLCLVRAWSAAGLAAGLLFLGTPQVSAQNNRDVDPEPSTQPAEVVTETVDLLKASKSGELNVVARGQGQERVQLTIRNTSSKRLNVVLPAGLVASSAAGQGGRGGMQSMGLGAFSNRQGSFGHFQTASHSEGLKSVGVEGGIRGSAVTVPAAESIEVFVPAVCLNYGLPSPTTRDQLTLMDVADYSTDARVRKSLRSLCLLGTSQGVAQAVMWRVCNDLPFETMVAEAGKVMNEQEIAIASRFVSALENSSDTELVDSSALSQGLVYVHIQGQGELSHEAERLNDQLENHRLLGLPVRVTGAETPEPSSPALFVHVDVTDSRIGETRGRVSVSYANLSGQWLPLGKATFQETSSLAVLDGDALAKAVDPRHRLGLRDGEAGPPDGGKHDPEN